MKVLSWNSRCVYIICIALPQRMGYIAAWGGRCGRGYGLSGVEHGTYVLFLYGDKIYCYLVENNCIYELKIIHKVK